jgi:hypothetical protein
MARRQPRLATTTPGAPDSRPRSCGVMAAGYAVMQSSMRFLDGKSMPRLEARGSGARADLGTISVARVRFVVRVLLELSVPVTFPVISVLRAIERAGSLIAKARRGHPSHAHQIRQRAPWWLLR